MFQWLCGARQYHRQIRNSNIEIRNKSEARMSQCQKQLALMMIMGWKDAAQDLVHLDFDHSKLFRI